MDIYTYVLLSVAQQEIGKLETIFSKKEKTENTTPIKQKKKPKEWER